MTGVPGCGKTAYSAWLAGAGPVPQDPDEASLLAKVRDAVAASHFCNAGEARGSISGARFAESVARQLAARFEWFECRLRERLRSTLVVNAEQKAEMNAGTMINVLLQLFVGASDPKKIKQDF